VPDNVTKFENPPVRGFLHHPAKAGGPGLAITHGAGANCTAPLLVAVADAFCSAGFLVLRFDLPFRQRRPFGPPYPNIAAEDRAGVRAAIDALRGLESVVVPADLLNLLSDAVADAGASVRSLVESDPGLEGSGSTLTAMLLSGSQLALVHIGDTRAYLFRDGGLFQITHDHTVTQSMIDAGRLTPEEAVSHPQRSLLLRAFSYWRDTDLAGMPPEQVSAIEKPEASLLDARPGDRYLLTSDGLTNVVPVAAIRETLAASVLSPAEVVRRLITLANEAGGPDNIVCAVADVTEAPVA